MNIAIIGFDREGKISYDYFRKQDHTITICDAKDTIDMPQGVNAIVGSTYLDNLNSYDFVVRTAGLPLDKLIKAGVTKDQLWSGTNEFFKVCPTKNIIGITGTKGKGTTTSLIAAMLRKAGYRVHVGGNIGRPALDLLNDNIQAEDWVVLELSSYQLSDIQSSPHIGVCLLIVPEHLDWHGDFANYTAAKANMFAYQSADDIAIYYANSEDSRAIAAHSNGTVMPYFSPPGAHIVDEHVVIDNTQICSVANIGLLGEHNWQNVCAAITAVWQITQDDAALRAAIQDFKGLEHRIEYLDEKDGVRYYNDSFATGLHATTAAINAIPEQKIVIIGGYDRMLNLDDFGDFIINHAKNVKHIMLIGDSKDRMARMLESKGFSSFSISQSTTMQTIIADAQTHAASGDAIVFSPGFASFDMFNNFEERGQLFKKEVHSL